MLLYRIVLMAEIELSDAEFLLFKNYIYKNIGISLSEQKKALIKGRLNKRVLELNLKSFREYYDFLVNDISGKEIAFFESAISTNVTSFLEKRHNGNGFKITYLPIYRQKKIKK